MNRQLYVAVSVIVMVISMIAVRAQQRQLGGYTSVAGLELSINMTIIMTIGNMQNIPVAFTASLNIDKTQSEYFRQYNVDLLRIEHWSKNADGSILITKPDTPWTGEQYFNIDVSDLSKEEYSKEEYSNELNSIINAEEKDYNKINGIIPNAVGSYYFIARVKIPNNQGGTRTLYSNIVLVQVTNAPVPYEQSATPTDGGLNLATGEEEREFGPDMVVENPSGSSASISRTYSSARAKLGYGSPGLPKGWVIDSDIKIVPAKSKPFMNDYLIIEFPNGSKEMWLVEPNISGTPDVTPPVKAPYTVKGTLDGALPPQWSSFVLTMRDHSTWTFTRSGSGDTLAYRLTTVTDANGQAITYSLDSTGRLNEITTTDGANTISLINCTYKDTGDRVLTSVSDENFYETADEKTKYARKVN